MTRLLRTLRWDIVFQWRYGLYLATAVSTLVILLVVRQIPAALLDLALPRDAEVVRRAGGFKLHVAGHFCVIHPVQHRLVLLWRYLRVLRDLHAAADRHKQE